MAALDLLLAGFSFSLYRCFEPGVLIQVHPCSFPVVLRCLTSPLADVS